MQLFYQSTNTRWLVLSVVVEGVIVQFVIAVHEKNKTEKPRHKVPKNCSRITPFFVLMTSPSHNNQHTNSNHPLPFWNTKPPVITTMHCNFVPFTLYFVYMNCEFRAKNSFYVVLYSARHVVVQLDEALLFKPEDRVFDSWWIPEFNWASNRNDYKEYFLARKSGQCVVLTILPLSYGYCL
jgi:hypothetical protein